MKDKEQSNVFFVWKPGVLNTFFFWVTHQLFKDWFSVSNSKWGYVHQRSLWLHISNSLTCDARVCVVQASLVFVELNVCSYGFLFPHELVKSSNTERRKVYERRKKCLTRDGPDCHRLMSSGKHLLPFLLTLLCGFGLIIWFSILIVPVHKVIRHYNRIKCNPFFFLLCSTYLSDVSIFKYEGGWVDIEYLNVLQYSNAIS